MGKLTAEQKVKQSQALKEAWAKRKAAKMVADTVKAAEALQPNYKEMYHDAMKQLDAANAKNTELEKICKSYAEQANNANKALQTMALEYDARTKYMLDCVKHAYLSIQFATNATDNNKGEK